MGRFGVQDGAEFRDYRVEHVFCVFRVFHEGVRLRKEKGEGGSYPDRVNVEDGA